MRSVLWGRNVEMSIEPRIEALAQRLKDTSLKPHAGLTPESTDRAEVDQLERAAEDALSAWREIEDPDDRQAQGALLAMLVGRSAAILHAHGRPRGAALIRTASELNPQDAWHTYGKQQPDGYVRLYEAQDLMEAGQESKAKKIAKVLEREMNGPGLDEALAELKKMERPLGSAPAMFTMNGIGTRLYGSRDERPDGTHVATLCLCLLYIPIFPLAAYRVFNHGGGSFSFVSRAPLSGFAIWARRLLVGTLAAALVFGVGHSVYNAPDRVAARAFASVEAEVAAHPEAAGPLWRGFAESEHAPHRADLAQRASERWLALELDALPAPLDMERAPRLRHTLGRLSALPAARRPDLRSLFARLLDAPKLTPSTEIGLLEKARALAPRSAAETRRALDRRLAELLEPSRPFDALATHMAHADQPGPRAEIVRLGALAAERWSLVGARASEVRNWLPLLGKHEDLKETQSLLTHALSVAARAPEDGERRAILESKKLRPVQRYARSHPGDDQVAMLLATLLLQKRQAAKAEDALLRGGSPGWLGFEAQTMLARLWSMDGRAEEAEALLEGQLAFQLPRMRAASQRYQQAIDALEGALEQRAGRGDMPPALEAAAAAESPERISAAFYAWMQEEMAKSPRIQALAEDYRNAVGVVTAAVDLGGLKLARANTVPAEQREALLREAEEIFLSVAEESEGLPNYHLGLGQVYYRLEKREEGEAELKEVLALDDPKLTRGVISVYRQLGLIEKARTLAESEHAKRSGPEKTALVRLLALMAEDLEGEQGWLRSIREKTDADLANLANVDAELAIREGDYSAAVKHLRRAYGLWKKHGDLDSTALNNRALAMSKIYPLNGDLEALRIAADDLEEAVRLQPDSAIALANHASLELERVFAAFFAQRLDLTHFPVEVGEAFTLLDAMSDTEGEALKAFARSEDARHMLQLMQRARVLAPARLDSYATEARFADFAEDEAHLRALLAAARRSLSLERERPDRPHDKQVEAMDRRIAVARKRSTRAKGRTGRAAAQYVLSSKLYKSALLRQEVGPLEEALTLLEAAEDGWPALADRGTRHSMELSRALLDTLRTHPALAERRRDEDWDADVAAFLSKLLDEGGQEDFLTAIRAHPSFEAALRTAKTYREPAYHAWLLAKVAGDEALARQHAPILSDPKSLIIAELWARLAPSASRTWALRQRQAHAQAAGADLP